MTKTHITRVSFSIALAALMALLPLAGALADSSFYFNDEFGNAYNIDQAQTQSIQISSGELFLVVGALNGSVTSNAINNAQSNIISAQIDGNLFTPAGTYIDFYLSNDNGTNWYQVQRGIKFMFPHPGTQLRWRAYVSRSILDFNPYLESVTVNYTTADNTAPGYAGNYQFGTQPSTFSGLLDPQGLVCNGLAILSFSCNASLGSTAPAVATSTTNSTTPGSLLSGLSFSIFGSPNTTTKSSNSTSTSNGLTAAIATAGAKDLNGNDINLVHAQGSNDIYELINGQKHLFPTPTIFAGYGYAADQVQTIPQTQLDKYPLAHLIQVKGDSKHTYYLTDNGLVRLIPSDTIFNSYGDRKEDIITVSQQEFNYYPVNQYIYLESPLNRDVFQITGGGKRYLTPMAVVRMGIKDDQVAPVNQTEFDSYKILAPVVN